MLWEALQKHCSICCTNIVWEASWSLFEESPLVVMNPSNVSVNIIDINCIDSCMIGRFFRSCVARLCLVQITLSGKVSSQYLTALLMAAPLAEGEGATEIISEGLISQPYVKMTIALMKQFCVEVALLAMSSYVSSLLWPMLDLPHTESDSYLALIHFASQSI